MPEPMTHCPGYGTPTPTTRGAEANRVRAPRRVLRALAPFCAFLAALILPLGMTWGAGPIGDAPKGSILAFLPNPKSEDYSDLPGLKRWLAAQGWAICDGSEGTPDLNYRMLLGTAHPDEAGQNLGSRAHEHGNRGETDIAYGREQAFLTGRGQMVRVPEAGHRHRLSGTTDRAEHLPLSLRVLFIMKIR